MPSRRCYSPQNGQRQQSSAHLPDLRHSLQTAENIAGFDLQEAGLLFTHQQPTVDAVGKSPRSKQRWRLCCALLQGKPAGCSLNLAQSGRPCCQCGKDMAELSIFHIQCAPFWHRNDLCVNQNDEKGKADC